MVVNTSRLFLRLLQTLRINTVCDVGSMDGSDALRFRAMLPGATIHAFEPHPGNFLRMTENETLKQRAVRVEPIALSNSDGTADLFLVDAADSSAEGWRGMSSLHARSNSSRTPGAARVRTARLDTYLSGQRRSDLRLALWIDTEGKAHEVIEGATGLLAEIHLLHVEVESRKCISEAQEFFYPQVKALLSNRGFAELATDQPRTRPQFNALFVRSDLPARTAWQIRQQLACARARAVLGRAVHKAFPHLAARLRGSRRAGPTAG